MTEEFTKFVLLFRPPELNVLQFKMDFQLIVE